MIGSATLERHDVIELHGNDDAALLLAVNAERLVGEDALAQGHELAAAESIGIGVVRLGP